MDEMRGRSADLGTTNRGIPGAVQEPSAPLDAASPPRSLAQEPARRQVAPAGSGERPWVGPRFFAALLIAVPLAVAMWLIIGWLISLIFF